MAVTQTRDLELLAPARNTDIGIAAIDCGADAVYIAGPQFGARQAAGNTVEDIRTLCSYAHKFGARIFITLNTILYDSELEQAFRQLEEIQEAGADAVIVQDLAVLEMVRRSAGLVKLPLHASTQCAIRTPDQAKFYEDLGFSRLILERELSLEQINAIREAVDCELEFFVHGALCVCYSGQCYMSEAITGRSANRGACAQACRSLYDLVDEDGKTLVKNKALLSLKDFNLKDRLADLAEAGVSSFKIEGRLKNISYVKNVVRDYSIALDTVVSSQDSTTVRYRRSSFGTVSGGFTPDLDKTFNRGYTSLFIDGKRGRWSTYDSAKGMGEEIGTVSDLNRDKTSFRIKPAAKWTAEGTGSRIRLNNGDGFSFVARNSEVVGFRADVCNGNEIRCKQIPELYPGARLFRNIDVAFEKELENSTPAREIHVTLEISTSRTPEGFSVTAKASSEDGRTAVRTFDGGIQCADNRQRMQSMFISQLSKSSGHYRFFPVMTEGKDETRNNTVLPFLPASALNNIRREMAAELDKAVCITRPLANRTPALASSAPSDACAAAKESLVTYKSNVSNQLAEQAYSRAGALKIEKAFEITHPDNVELMRMKYCIRYELGLCPKQKPATVKKLYLINNGRRFPLKFDCAKCEMAVLSNIQ